VFIEAKDDGSGGDNWSYKSYKLQSSSQIITTNQHAIFLQAGYPSCRPTNSVKALKHCLGPYSWDKSYSGSRENFWTIVSLLTSDNRKYKEHLACNNFFSTNYLLVTWHSFLVSFCLACFSAHSQSISSIIYCPMPLPDIHSPCLVVWVRNMVHNKAPVLSH